MSGTSHIQWTDATWNVVLGCDRVSSGCAKCYAINDSYRMAGSPHPKISSLYGGLVERQSNGQLDWTGTVRLVPERLRLPMQWKKPSRVFVNSMSDLWHDDVPDEFIEQVFAVMALCPQHQFQILTKRPERMWRWFSESAGMNTREQEVAHWAASMGGVVWDGRGSDPAAYINVPLFHLQPATGDFRSLTPKERRAALANRRCWPGWPLPNVWLGVSVENHTEAERRIPWIIRTPAAVRFLSCEPLLAPVSLWPWLRNDSVAATYGRSLPMIDWTIVGGESGPHARRMDLNWAYVLVEQCRDAGVPCFVKQLGSRWAQETGARHHKGGEIAEFPAGLQVREYPQEGVRVTV